ncbi:hypothetical protein Trydic_g10903 [Trypoxylus dichotomus]
MYVHMITLAAIFALVSLTIGFVNAYNFLDVPETYVDTPLWPPKRIKDTDLRFVVKVIAVNQTLGVGVCIKPTWVLTTKFFEHDYDVIVVTSWDHTWEGKGGQTRKVSKIIINPLLNTDSCNFDVVLLGLDKAFVPTMSVGMISYKSAAKPKVNDVVTIAASYPDGIQAKEERLRPMHECEMHVSYYLYAKCENPLYCLTIAENVYGAPILHQGKLIGIVSSEIDAEKVVFHWIDDYKDWLDQVATSTILLRSFVPQVYIAGIAVPDVWLGVLSLWNNIP